MGWLFSIIGWAIFGLIIGAIARFLVPGRQSMSWFMTMLLGIVGSFAGGLIWKLIFDRTAETVSPTGYIFSTIGAVIVLLVYIRLKR